MPQKAMSLLQEIIDANTKNVRRLKKMHSVVIRLIAEAQ